MSDLVGLCEMPWARENQFSAQEIVHIDVALDVSKAASTPFCQLDFSVDALQYCVGNVRLDKVNDAAFLFCTIVEFANLGFSILLV